MEVELIVDRPAAGTWNMAVDEMLLEAAAREGRRVLRFYGWHEPTLSLGYFQRLGERGEHASSRDCALVRRATGGGAILHDRELTYSFVAPEQGLGGHQALYDLFHETIVEWLAEQGIAARRFESSGGLTCAEAPPTEPFLCFQRRAHGDVVAPVVAGSAADERAERGEFKVLGSAQRRLRTAILQHGSLLLERSSCAPELPGLRELAGLRASPSEVWEAWTKKVAARTGWSWRETAISPVENALAERLQFERYGADSWTGRRA